MTPTAAAVAASVGALVAVVAAPSGAWARWTLRRGRRGEVRHDRRLRPPVGHGAARWSVQPLVPLADLVGRLTRSVARRPPSSAADRRVGTAVLAGVVAVVVAPLAAAPVGAVVWAAPAWRERNERRAYERSVRSTLPDVVDLFRLAVGAGLSAHQAVDVVTPRSPEPVRSALDEIHRRVVLGARLGDALDALDVLGDPVLPLAAALKGAARHGAPLTASLERVAADARVLRRRRAEEEARRLPVQLLFPLVLCVLPAFGLLAVVPLLLASLRSLQL